LTEAYLSVYLTEYDVGQANFPGNTDVFVRQTSL